MNAPTHVLQPRRNLLQPFLLAVWIGLVLLLGGAGGIVRSLIILSGQPQPVDFSTFYLAGRVAAFDPERIYDTAALEAVQSAAEQEGSAYQVGPWAGPFAYPPFFAALMKPLGALPFVQAVWVWTGINMALLLACLPPLLSIAGLRAGALPVWQKAVLAVLVLGFYPPASEVLSLGQVGTLLLFLTVLSLALLRKEKPFWQGLAGVLLGVAAGIKIFPGVLLVYLVLRRKWAAVVGGAVGFLATLLIGALGVGGWQTGWATTLDYFTVRLFGTYSARFAFLHPGNQSVTVLFIRTFGETGLGRMLGIGFVGLIFLATWMFLVRRNSTLRSHTRQALEFAIVSLLPLLVPTGVYSHSYVLALLPFAAVYGVSTAKGSPGGMRYWLAAAYLLAITSSYAEWLKWPVFTLIPFGLIGILILWTCLMIALLKPYQAADAPVAQPSAS